MNFLREVPVVLSKKYFAAAAGSERYALTNPGLSKIKLAENYTRQAGMEAFFKKTFCRAGILGAAVLFLLVAAMWGAGARALSRQKAGSADFASSVRDLMRADSSIQEVRMIDSTRICVYLDEETWESYTEREKSAYCLSLSGHLKDLCRVSGLWRTGEELSVYYYSGDGVLLARTEGL